VAFVPSIPRNPSGKALKRLLRKKDEHKPVKKEEGVKIF
jgi:acyl-coenzyme A synthetase/AMP-(fatty) acid ligase